MDSHLLGPVLVALTLGATACGKTPAASEPPTSGGPATAATAATATPRATAATTQTTAVPSAVDVPGLDAKAKEIRDGLPKGSGDYAEVLALATLHKEGKLPYPDFEQAILAKKLPPHKLGDGYLMIPVPKPPPPAEFEPKMMPKDWQGTWGEVAMAYWLGALDKKLYAKLHRAAHPDRCEHD